MVLDLSKLKVAAKHGPTYLGTIEESKKSGLLNKDTESINNQDVRAQNSYHSHNESAQNSRPGS